MAKQSIGFERGLREGEDEEAIKRLFTPEFRNRLDSTIAFSHLAPDTMMLIVDKFLLQLEAQLHDRNVEIAATDAAREWLGKKGYDRAFGARPLGRVIQEHVKRPMSEEVLFGKLENGGRVTVDVKDGDVVFEYEEPVRPLKSKKGGARGPKVPVLAK
jgi:ATP-dependent Clp protease ATP-binding subunit ClpA